MVKSLALAIAGQISRASAGPEVSFYCVQQCDDGTYPDYCINHSTKGYDCGDVPQNCHVMAWQTFRNERICEGFKFSQPTCYNSGQGQWSNSCPEAIDFQLVFDRDRQYEQQYRDSQFGGLLWNLIPSNGFLAYTSPDSQKAFIPQTGLEAVISGWKGAGMGLDRHPTKVLSIVDNRRCIIHEVGVWNKGAPRYTRWAFKDYVDIPRWMDETDVIFNALAPEASEASVSLTSGVWTGDYTSIINKRYSTYTELYSAGDFKGLAAQLYTAEAVAALMAHDTHGTFVAQQDEQNFLAYLSSLQAEHGNLTFTAQSAYQQYVEGEDIIHEVGVDSEGAQHYVRWQNEEGQWKIATQVLAGHAVSTYVPGISPTVMTCQGYTPPSTLPPTTTTVKTTTAPPASTTTKAKTTTVTPAPTTTKAKTTTAPPASTTTKAKSTTVTPAPTTTKAKTTTVTPAPTTTKAKTTTAAPTTTLPKSCPFDGCWKSTTVFGGYDLKVIGSHVDVLTPDGPTFPFTTYPNCSCTLQLDFQTIAHGQLSSDGQTIQFGPVLNDDTWNHEVCPVATTTPAATTAKTTPAPPPPTTTAAPTTVAPTTTSTGCNFDGMWQSTNVFGGYPLTVSGNEVSVQDGPTFPFTAAADCSCTLQLDLETIAHGQLSADAQTITWGQVLNEDVWTRRTSGVESPGAVIVI